MKFLLGPAGSGKTHQCLAEARAMLKASPEGLPLIFLAPRQATFQLERQLLASGEIEGFTRLQIVSFDRLARFILQIFSERPPKILSDTGRVMVLRALLADFKGELRSFARSARTTGFAEHLSVTLRELQHQQISPGQLRLWADTLMENPRLADKLRDLAMMLGAYEGWLAANGLADSDSLLPAATDTVRKAANKPGVPLRFGGLWLDGFAEMTPQEMNLLMAILPFCEKATLAFCLDPAIREDRLWHSSWCAVQQSFSLLHVRIAALMQITPTIVHLPQTSAGVGRFKTSPDLEHLAAWWDASAPKEVPAAAPEAIRVVRCASPEGEAIHAAREVLRFVRGGGRFREAAVLLRSLDGYRDALQRAFRRYEIPFFVDQRQSIAHHPMAEVTRCALRTVAFGWRHEDLFGALKAGFSPVPETVLDFFENAALEFGWTDKHWKESLVSEKATGKEAEKKARAEEIKRAVLGPYRSLEKSLGGAAVNGTEVAAALRALWEVLEVPRHLGEWASEQAVETPQSPTVHQTVWTQMLEWLANVELAFSGVALPLRQWIPILEAGLTNLTIGVIPPVLDEVMIGAVDRSRNPELKLALVLGMNEGVFPAPPPPPGIITDSDRDALKKGERRLGPTQLDWIARERFYGYIALTRASERVVLSYSQFGADDKQRNPSPFLARLRILFPALEEEEFAETATHWYDTQHSNDLAESLLRARASSPAEAGPWLDRISSWPETARRLGILTSSPRTSGETVLSQQGVERLYGRDLRLSVTNLERHAACPFQFFVRAGLKAEERKFFEADRRELGSFQHQVLRLFHEQLQQSGQRWRDLSPDAAVKLVGEIGERLRPEFANGLFAASDTNRYTAERLIQQLQDFIRVIIGWMPQCEFDPVAVELRFNDGQPIPAWKFEFPDGRSLRLHGVIDRIDLFRNKETGEAYCVILDYKARGKDIDPVHVENCLQAQPPAYLLVLARQPEAWSFFKVSKIIPVGMFYVPVAGKTESGKSRAEVLATAQQDATGKMRYQHSGLFNARYLDYLDNRHAEKGDQFNYSRKKSGELSAVSKQPRSSEQFSAVLDHVEARLIETGKQILAGDADVAPYRQGSKTPCAHCDYLSICRFDPWNQGYRSLDRVTVLTKAT